jgi:hypothetical protein
MNHIPSILVVSLGVAALVACGKAPETASEKLAEKMIESAAGTDGSKTKVDLASDGTKVTTTDASGRTTQLEVGGAKVSEADVGVPFYPGSQPADGQSSRASTPDGNSYTVVLHTDDATDRVASFYRDKLKAQSEGRQFMDMSAGEGNTTLVLSDEKAKSMVQIHVLKADKGTDVQIVAHRGVAK